jgi:hypothetical protein
MTNSLNGNAANRVVVVPARFALNEYLRYSVYICQPYRSFQQCARMAFYTDNKIDRHIPRIAFTQNQRYVSLLSLQQARYTSGLVDY